MVLYVWYLTDPDIHTVNDLVLLVKINCIFLARVTNGS